MDFVSCSKHARDIEVMRVLREVVKLRVRGHGPIQILIGAAGDAGRDALNPDGRHALLPVEVRVVRIQRHRQVPNPNPALGVIRRSLGAFEPFGFLG
jgi:hypothetical protein